MERRCSKVSRFRDSRDPAQDRGRELDIARPRRRGVAFINCPSERIDAERRWLLDEPPQRRELPFGFIEPRASATKRLAVQLAELGDGLHEAVVA